MHYYTFKPKDYMSKTAFLEPMEDLAYRRMLDHCYLTEQPLPNDIEEIAMLIRMRSHCDCIAIVLRRFFELTANGYVNDRVEREISAYHEKSNKAKASANARWGKKSNKDNGLSVDANALRNECESNANHKPITNNHKPITNNHKPITNNQDIDTSDKPNKKSVLKLMPNDFGISDQVRKWAIENNHQNLELHLERFTEYARSNAKKYADWDSAFKRAIREDWGKVNKPVYQNNGYQNQNRPPDIGEYMKNMGNDFLDVTPENKFLEIN